MASSSSWRDWPILENDTRSATASHLQCHDFCVGNADCTSVKHSSNHFQLLFLRHARQLRKSGERIKFTVHPSPQPHEATHTSRASSSAPLRAFCKSSATTAPAAPTATPAPTNNHQAGPEGSSAVMPAPLPVLVLVLVLTASVVTH